MNLKDADAWRKAQDANPPSEPYGHRIVTYAEDWANAMEREMARGAPLEVIAADAAHEANMDNGISGFMYGAAVAILAAVWEHGDDLRRCHNLSTQVVTEGERANESGGTLNPALLSFD